MTRPGTAEAGRTSGSDVVHAVRPGLRGPTATCGAGRIVERVPGRFDEAAQTSCPTCA